MWACLLESSRLYVEFDELPFMSPNLSMAFGICILLLMLSILQETGIIGTVLYQG